MMSESVFFILFFALLADWFFGEPKILWSRLPHPVVLLGNAVGYVDKKFNLESDDDAKRMRKGAIAVSVLIIVAILIALALQKILSLFGPISILVEIFIVFTLLAQKSLKDHVMQVVIGLRDEGIDGGRKAVGMIVGRDPKMLDQQGVARASIETLAENFSDGVVAPAFWYLVFGLPGIFAYKMINTADSMIAYKTERHLHFGKVAALIDDLANWVPARLSVIFLSIGALWIRGFTSSKNAIVVALKDADLHRSPNAGWPEGAMAGALNFALGGPRVYPQETVQQSFINGSGKQGLGTAGIEDAVAVFSSACISLMGFIALGWVLF